VGEDWTSRHSVGNGPSPLPAIRPLGISAAALAMLECGDAVVRAGHRHGATLEVHGCDDEIFLGGSERGLFPVHIVARAPDIHRLLVVVDEGRAETTIVKIDVTETRAFHPRIASNLATMQAARAQANLNAVAQWLRENPTPLGLEVTAKELFNCEDGPLKILLAPLHDCLPAVGALRKLIGRGRGATPAGDDLIIGALAHAWAGQGRAAALVSAMRSIETDLSQLTTSTGATGLRAAIRGEFGTHLIAFVRSLRCGTCDQVLAHADRTSRHGATSGLDTLTGFVVAAAASSCASPG
jgi:hypothetical protein